MGQTAGLGAAPLRRRLCDHLRPDARRPAARTVEQLSHAVAALDPFRLAGLSPLVTVGGSLVAALAVLEKAMGPEAAWDAVSIDDRWQIEQWGADAEAEAALENRQRDFMAAARFLDLLIRASDELPDEAQQVGLALATEPFRGNDRPNLLQTLVHVVVDQDVIIFRPVADLAGGALHPPGDHLFTIGALARAGGVPTRASTAAG